MPVFDIYSRRKRRAERGQPEVYQYDHVSHELRLQVRHILDAALGHWVLHPMGKPDLISHNEFLRSVYLQLLKEKALPRLSNQPERGIKPIGGINYKEEILEGVTGAFPEVDDWLDVVEICFCDIRRLANLNLVARKARGIVQDPNDAIEELNIRFRQAGFGYQFEAGQIVRVDSRLLHSEVVKPALVLLADPRFAGAQDEFHYRAGEYEDAIVDANRAFESTMRAICDIKRWTYPKGARASDLIKVVRMKGLLPDYLDLSFDQLIATLKSGLPKVRDEAGGHGQGATPRETPGYIAGYALHLAAANIVLLVEALRATESTTEA